MAKMGVSHRATPIINCDGRNLAVTDGGERFPAPIRCCSGLKKSLELPPFDRKMRTHSRWSQA